MTGDAEWDRRQDRAEQHYRWHRIKRPWLHGWFPERERAIGRNKNIRDDNVVTASPAQPNTVPRVDDFAVSNREQQDTRGRRAVCQEARFGTVKNPATTNYPGGLLATASERPPAGDPVPPIDNRSLPNGRNAPAILTFGSLP